MKNKKILPDKCREDVIHVDYSDEMQSSYIDYALSVITERALPDVRDGFKPVHRRILWAMKELGLKPTGDYKKSARIVGETMGKFHPHGDSSIYDAMVHMAQEWCYNYPLVDGHGNFGSIEGDSPAAARYTEAKLSSIADELYLADIDKNIVNFVPNFDNSEKEPSILPVQVPNILISGTEGIAVGMACKMPTHNLGEVLDATVTTLTNPKITTKELLQYIKGPDFATGGLVSNPDDLLNIYESGQGKIRVRGIATIEDGDRGKQNIVISEIPFTMIGAIDKFMDTIADMVRNKTMPDVVDIKNLSSKDGIKIVVELKKGADAQYNLNLLYKKAKLEDTFGYNALLLHNGSPEQMSLKNILQEFIAFYKETLTRKYTYLLEKELKQKEVQDGLLTAINCIDAIIEVLRGSKKVDDAKNCLINGDVSGIAFKTKTSEKMASKFNFTEIQANAILEMKLQRLIGLEMDALLSEIKKHEKNIKEYRSLLESNTKMKNHIKNSLLSIKERYAIPRKTKIEDVDEIVIAKPEIPNEDVFLLINRFNYIKIIDEATYERNRENVANDYKYYLKINNHDKIAIFSDMAKCHIIKVSDVPFGKYNDKGVPIEQISNLSSEENILYINAMSELIQGKLLFVTQKGMIKYVLGDEFNAVKRTIDASKLSPGDKLHSIIMHNDTDNNILIISKKKLAIRFRVADVSLLKKNSIGVRAYRLADNDGVMLTAVGTPSDVIKIEDKELSFSYVKLSKRDAKGTRIKV